MTSEGLQLFKNIIIDRIDYYVNGQDIVYDFELYLNDIIRFHTNGTAITLQHQYIDSKGQIHITNYMFSSKEELKEWANPPGYGTPLYKALYGND